MNGLINRLFLLSQIKTDQQNLIVGLSLLIVGIVMMLLFMFLHWWFKNQKDKYTFNRRKKESQGIWEFTKKNFFIFLALFFLIMTVTGITMLLA